MGWLVVPTLLQELLGKDSQNFNMESESYQRQTQCLKVKVIDVG